MDTLPSEIIENILCYLPQRYAATIASTVCKRWNELLLRPTFYATIDIYSSTEFQTLLKKVSESNTDNNIGSFVKHLIFHSSFRISNDQVGCLRVFPNLQSFTGGLKLYKSMPSYFVIKQPSHISYWNLNEKNVKLFDDIRVHLKTLDIHVSPSLVFSQQHQEQGNYKPIYIIKLDNDNNKNNNENNRNDSLRSYRNNNLRNYMNNDNNINRNIHNYDTNYMNNNIDDNNDNDLNLLMRRNTIRNNNNIYGLDNYCQNISYRVASMNGSYGCTTERRMDETGRRYAICACQEHSIYRRHDENNRRNNFISELIENNLHESGHSSTLTQNNINSRRLSLTSFNTFTRHRNNQTNFINTGHNIDYQENSISPFNLTISEQSRVDDMYYEIGRSFRSRLRRIDERSPSLKLVLPTLSNLTKLNISFGSDENELVKIRFLDNYIDERTFESIHQSCPLLESLSFENVSINISNDFAHLKTSISSAHYLKHLHINGVINDPAVYKYILMKYTHLESLFLQFDILTLLKYFSVGLKSHPIIGFNDYDTIGFKETIDELIRLLPSLKSISIRFFNLSSSISNQDIMKVFLSYWPHEEFLDWLHYNPKRLSHLEYPCKLNFKMYFNMTNFRLIRTPQLHILNHLTSLSLFIDDVIDLVLKYLSKMENRNTAIVSTCLKELEIKQPHYLRKRKLCMDDWLVVFPNLSSLKLNGIYKIIDSIDFANENSNRKGYTLHELIKKRLSESSIIQWKSLSPRQREKRRLDCNNNNDKLYKLKKLEICHTGIHFTNAFYQFLIKCQQLNHLELNKIKFFLSGEAYLQDHHFATIPNECLSITLYLPYQFLKCLKIKDIQFKLYDSYHDVNLLLVHETLSNITYEHSIDNKTTSEDDDLVILKIKCKYIDGLIFSF